MQKTRVLGLSSTVILLGIVSFITDLSSEMMMPLLPLFVTSMGGTGMAIGLIGGLGDGIASILQVLSGYLSDRMPRRKPLVAIGYGISGVFKFMLAYAGAWPQVLAARVLERTGKSVRTAPRDAIIAEVADERIRGRAFGFHHMLDSAGAVGGACLALLFFWYLDMEIRHILLISAVIALAALVPLWKLREPDRTASRNSFFGSLNGLSGRLKLFLAAGTIFGLANFSYMFFVLRARDFFLSGQSEREAAAIAIGLYVLLTLADSVLSLPFGSLSDRFGRGKVLLCGYLMFVFVHLGFAVAASQAWFIVLFLVYGAATAIVKTTQKAFVSDLAKADCKGVSLGAFHTCCGLAIIAGALIAGHLWDASGAAATFYYGAAAATLASMLLVAVIGQGSARPECR